MTSSFFIGFAMIAPIFVLAFISPMLVVSYAFALAIIMLYLNAKWIDEATQKKEEVDK